MTFVDLTKAFDTVNLEGLWKIMANFGCPAKFIAVQRKHMSWVLIGGVSGYRYFLVEKASYQELCKTSSLMAKKGFVGIDANSEGPYRP